MELNCDIHINSIELKHFRQFSSEVFFFNKRINVLQGGLYSGKTSVCDSIRFILSPICYLFGYQQKIEKLTDDDIYHRNGKKEEKVKIEAKIDLTSTEYLLTRIKTRYEYDDEKKTYEKIEKVLYDIKNKIDESISLKQNNGIILPFMGYYKNRIEKQEDLETKSEIDDDILVPYKVYGTSLEKETKFKEFRQWFKNIYIQVVFSELHGRKEFDFCKQYLKVINKIAILTIKELKGITVDVLGWDYKVDRLFIKVGDKELSVTEVMGRGYESLFYSVVDMAHRIIRMNSAEEIFLRETKGIVILDNFEKFNKDIFERYIKYISGVFSKIQFIISGNVDTLKLCSDEIQYVKL